MLTWGGGNEADQLCNFSELTSDQRGNSAQSGLNYSVSHFSCLTGDGKLHFKPRSNNCIVYSHAKHVAESGIDIIDHHYQKKVVLPVDKCYFGFIKKQNKAKQKTIREVLLQNTHIWVWHVMRTQIRVNGDVIGRVLTAYGCHLLAEQRMYRSVLPSGISLSICFHITCKL